VLEPFLFEGLLLRRKKIELIAERTFMPDEVVFQEGTRHQDYFIKG
jgi:hypothetical protein